MHAKKNPHCRKSQLFCRVHVFTARTYLGISCDIKVLMWCSRSFCDWNIAWFCVRGISWPPDTFMWGSQQMGWWGGTYIIAVGSRRLTLSSPHRALLWFFLMLWWSGRWVNYFTGRWLHFQVSLIYQMVLSPFSFIDPGPTCHTYSGSKRPKWPSVQ